MAIRLFDEDGIEYEVYWDERIKTNVFQKVHTDECTSKAQEKRREERIRKESRRQG